jgi:hypothetical protein
MTKKVTKTSQIIELLQNSPDGLTLREVADTLGFKGNIVGGTLYSLIDRGMVAAEDDAGTKRFRYLGETVRRTWPTPMRVVKAAAIETLRAAGEAGMAMWQITEAMSQYPAEQVYFAVNRLVYAELAYRLPGKIPPKVAPGEKQHMRGSRVFALTDLNMPADDLTKTPVRQNGLRKDLIAAIEATGETGMTYAEIVRMFPGVHDASALTVISRLRQDGIISRVDKRFRIVCTKPKKTVAQAQAEAAAAAQAAKAA